MPRGEPAAVPMTGTAERVRHQFAPAKINLALHVVGRRGDGYHLLDMLVAFADIGDRVTWVPGGDCCRLDLQDRLDCRPEPVPETTDNLAWRALALAGRLGTETLAGTLTVDKTLPSGGGIGGGSSDAAAVLRAVLGDQAAADPAVRDQALALGADLPVCLFDRPARVEGIGDRVAPVRLARPLPVVLIWPGTGLSTPAVFNVRVGAYGRPIPAAAISRLERDPLAAIAELRNDLEEPACGLLPAVASALDLLRASSGCRIARMSGSGSTVVGYFADTASSTTAAAAIAALNPGWWVRSTTIRSE